MPTEPETAPRVLSLPQFTQSLLRRNTMTDVTTYTDGYLKTLNLDTLTDAQKMDLYVHLQNLKFHMCGAIDEYLKNHPELESLPGSAFLLELVWLMDRHDNARPGRESEEWDSAEKGVALLNTLEKMVGDEWTLSKKLEHTIELPADLI